MPPFADARVLADGGGERYLRQVCPHQHLAACDLANGTPQPIEYYLWYYPLEAPLPDNTADPVKDVLVQFDRLQSRHVTDAEADQRRRFVAEQSRLALGGLSVGWASEARRAFTDGAAAFLNFGVDRNFDSVQWLVHGGPTLLRAQTKAILPGGVECAGSAQTTCGRYDLSWAKSLQYGAILLSFALLCACSIPGTATPKGELIDFLCLTLLLVFVNAVLCGAISGAYSRYQARVEWLIPLSALFLAAQWIERARPAANATVAPGQAAAATAP